MALWDRITSSRPGPLAIQATALLDVISFSVARSLQEGLHQGFVPLFPLLKALKGAPDHVTGQHQVESAIGAALGQPHPLHMLIKPRMARPPVQMPISRITTHCPKATTVQRYIALTAHHTLLKAKPGWRPPVHPRCPLGAPQRQKKGRFEAA